jgi:hypothetical protein
MQAQYQRRAWTATLIHVKAVDRFKRGMRCAVPQGAVSIVSGAQARSSGWAWTTMPTPM